VLYVKPVSEALLHFSSCRKSVAPPNPNDKTYGTQQ